MFPKNTYLLPQAPSHLHPPPSDSVVDFNGVEILLHRHRDMFSGHYLGTNAPPPPPPPPPPPHFLQGASVLNGDPSNASQTVKKDRHSKIYTSQGPRDRRVRLSMGIARKFFDLQEMLGFDKPSKTLDWLLTKSKAAIKELVQAKENKSSSSPSECEVLSSDALMSNRSHLGGEDPKGKHVVGASNLAKESRAKARARARERTREKMSIKNLNEAKITGSNMNHQHSIPAQFRNNQLEFLQLFAGSSSGNANSCGLKGNSILHCNEDLIHEPAGGSRRKQKNQTFFGFQQNFAVSRDMASNYNISSANASENWSNLYAVLEQQKFISSTSNI